jgi:hypothetical protein
MRLWRVVNALQLSELDAQLAALAERLRERRGDPEDELLLRCHIDMLLDERLSRVPAPLPLDTAAPTPALGAHADGSLLPDAEV